MPRRGLDKAALTGRIVPAEGPADAQVMLIGERPGVDEADQGRPFVGLAGQELDRYLSAAYLRREAIYITNLVKTYADADPKAGEVAEWVGLLEEEIASVRPKFIGTLGAFATKALLGQVSMDAVHGVPFAASGSILSCLPEDCQVVPILHPAAAFYSPESGKLVQYDFEQLGAIIKGADLRRADEHDQPWYRIVKGEEVTVVAPVIAVDTEGWRHNPWGLTYSAMVGAAACRREGVTIFDGHVYLHNSLHDLAVLEALGSPIDESKFTDTMVLAYLLECEPQGLKDLAFRHCGMEMHSYDSVLAPAQQSLALEYLHGLAVVDWGESEPYVIVKIEDGEQKVLIKHPHSLNRYIDRIIADAESKGANPVKRWNGIDDTIKERAIAQFGDMPEATLDDIPLPDAVHYACRDADATLRIAPILRKKVADAGMELVSGIDHAAIPMFNRMQIVGMRVDKPHFERLAAKCEIIMQEKVEAIKSLTGCTINPNSDDQVAELLFDVLGLIPTKMTKGGKNAAPKPSTNAKVLTELLDMHEAVPLISDYREASKVRNSFCLPIPRYASADGRIHPNIRITRVSSGRPSATSPNLLAIPVRSELGREVRAGFVPSPGNVLATWDLNQIEMRHMAQVSGDNLLKGLFIEGKRDVHGETGARMFGVPYDTAMANPMQYRYPAKRTGFGVITGITGMGLLDQMRLAKTGVQWTEHQCDAFIQDWFRVYPQVRRFMEDCKTECRRFGYVRDCWGRMRRLPAVHSVIPRFREEAGRQAHSHKIQAGAAGIMKIAMAAIWADLKAMQQSGVKVECILQIYDELIFDLEPGAFYLLDEMVTRHLTTAHKKLLDWYEVPLKAKGVFGPNWAALEK